MGFLCVGGSSVAAFFSSSSRGSFTAFKDPFSLMNSAIEYRRSLSFVVEHEHAWLLAR